MSRLPSLLASSGANSAIMASRKRAENAEGSQAGADADHLAETVFQQGRRRGVRDLFDLRCVPVSVDCNEPILVEPLGGLGGSVRHVSQRAHNVDLVRGRVRRIGRGDEYLVAPVN